MKIEIIIKASKLFTGFGRTSLGVNRSTYEKAKVTLSARDIKDHHTIPTSRKPIEGEHPPPEWLNLIREKTGSPLLLLVPLNKKTRIFVQDGKSI